MTEATKFRKVSVKKLKMHLYYEFSLSVLRFNEKILNIVFSGF